MSFLKKFYDIFFCRFRFQIGEDNSLHLRHVIQDDEGIYICRAENGWGAETMMVTLDVNSKLGGPPPLTPLKKNLKNNKQTNQNKTC